jgi:hypothetical protein
MLCSRLGTRWSDIDVTKSLKAGMVGEQFVGSRGPLRDRDDTRSSPHPSMVTLGCLYEEDKRGKGQGRYLSWLGSKPGMDPAIRIGLGG